MDGLNISFCSRHQVCGCLTMSSCSSAGLACRSLVDAVQKSRLEEIRTRLGKGDQATTSIIVNQRSRRSRTTALHVAANNGNAKAVEILMKSKSLDLEVSV